MFDRRQILLKVYKLFDLLVMVCSFALATWMTYYQSGPVSLDEFLSMRIKVQNFVLFVGLLFVWHLSFQHLAFIIPEDYLVEVKKALTSSRQQPLAPWRFTWQ